MDSYFFSFLRKQKSLPQCTHRQEKEQSYLLSGLDIVYFNAKCQKLEERNLLFVRSMYNVSFVMWFCSKWYPSSCLAFERILYCFREHILEFM